MKRALALLALVGCGDDVQVFAEPRTIELSFPSAPNHKLDLLFMIDDSPGGPEIQAPLALSMTAVFDQLRAGGTLPDLHIGVLTSDLGTMGSLDPSQPGPPIGQVGNGGCVAAGDDARLQTFGTTVVDAFVIDEDDGAGGRRRNYQGELSDVVGMIFRGAGGGGCGFEQPLHAIRRALTQASNQGFLRPDAHLGIVILTDEDDCSFRDPALLRAETPDLGPLQSFRCSLEGLVCDEPMDQVGEKNACRAREDSRYVEGIAQTRDALIATKARPSDLSVISIVGLPSVAVELRNPPGGGVGQLALAHSCGTTGPQGLQVADPGVRIAELTKTFEGRGDVLSVCDAETPERFAGLARILKHPVGVICLDSTQLTDSNTERGIQPACELTEIDGTTETRILDFEIVPDAAACPETSDHLRLFVNRTSPASPTAYVRARCETPF
ncbi:MAG: hypothetical protein H0T42_10765 [Deltaproteobacteria bacterium]|nr:hypothetical protein [Deltaproteobacteria bacterium]